MERLIKQKRELLFGQWTCDASMNTKGYICYEEHYWLLERNLEYTIRIYYPDGTMSYGKSCYDEIVDGEEYHFWYCGMLAVTPSESSYMYWPGKPW